MTTVTIPDWTAEGVLPPVDHTVPSERVLLLSEITTIKGFLAEMTEDEIIVHKSYESRLGMIEKRIAELDAEPRQPAAGLSCRTGCPGYFHQAGL